MGRKWTPEQKAAQAEKIKAWKPWEHSTGPKTRAGKRRCRMNAVTHGCYTAEHKVLRHALSLQREFVRGCLYFLQADAARSAYMDKKIKGTDY